MRHVKDPYIDAEVAIVGKIIGHLSPTVPLSLLEVSRVLVDVGRLAVQVGTSKALLVK
jgi:hypothetical protein